MNLIIIPYIHFNTQTCDNCIFLHNSLLFNSSLNTVYYVHMLYSEPKIHLKKGKEIKYKHVNTVSLIKYEIILTFPRRTFFTRTIQHFPMRYRRYYLNLMRKLLFQYFTLWCILQSLTHLYSQEVWKRRPFSPIIKKLYLSRKMTTSKKKFIFQHSLINDRKNNMKYNKTYIRKTASQRRGVDIDLLW